MAAPTPTARITPTAAEKLVNGHQTLHTFALDADIELWETEVGLAGWDGGEAIDHTTQHQTEFRVFAPRNLKTQTPYTFKFQFSYQAYNAIKNLINKRTTCTETLPDGTTVAFYGFAQKVEFDPLVEGQPPTGTMTVVPTNWDHVNNVEAGPVVTPGTGTSAIQ